MNKENGSLYRRLTAGAIVAGLAITSCARKPEQKTASDLRVDQLSTQIADLSQELTAQANYENYLTAIATTEEAIATPTPGATATVEVVPSATAEVLEGKKWTIEYFKEATDQIKDWKFGDLNPVNWPDFPNVDNPRVGFVAANGLEYGMDESLYAQQNETADFVVPARHYRLYTGDYNIAGIDSCVAAERSGCGILVVNVGEVTASFENQMFDTGFTVDGRYWNGDELPQAVVGVLSHTAHNMLNLSGGSLNAGEGSTNAGSNCSVPGGCDSGRMAFAIVSGNELLARGVTEVSR